MMPRYTPIFEFCSRSQRIVIDYPTADLVLLAIRNNLTGNYISYDDMVELAKDYNITVVQNIDISININVLVEFIRANEDSEGIVIRFDTGHMIKIKSDWYVRIHKAKDKIRFEKDLVENIINESVDDLKPLLTEDDRIMIAKYENKMQEKIHQVTNHIEMIVKEALNKYTNRKDYAVEFVKKQPEHLKSILFYAYEGKNVKEELIKQIKKNCTSQNNLESVRHLIGLDNKKEWNNNHG
jgi:RNA ligase